MDPKDLGAPTATSDAAIAPSPGLVASPLLFTPQEFAAMFPRPPTWPAAMSDSEVSFSDPARDARGPQLKPADLLVELKPFPTLRRFTGVQFWFLPLTAPQTLRYIFTTLAVSASFALVWPFGAGRFETRMIVTGFVLQLCFNTVRTVMWGTYNRRKGWRWTVEQFGENVAENSYRGLVNWIRLFDWSTSPKNGSPSIFPA